MAQKKGGRRESGNPAVRASGTPPRPAAAAPTGWRRRFEARSAPFLAYLAQQPRWLFPLIMAALLLAGLMVPVPWVGGLLLLVLVVVLVWLTVLSWPVLSGAGRLLRLITILAALAVAAMRFTGQL